MEPETTRLGRLLARAGGYSVHSTTGRRLGHLIWLTYELEGAFPAGLRVQPPGRREPAPATSWEIPLNRVVAVLPGRRALLAGPRTPDLEAVRSRMDEAQALGTVALERVVDVPARAS